MLNKCDEFQIVYKEFLKQNCNGQTWLRYLKLIEVSFKLIFLKIYISWLDLYIDMKALTFVLWRTKRKVSSRNKEILLDLNLRKEDFRVLFNAHTPENRKQNRVVKFRMQSREEWILVFAMAVNARFSSYPFNSMTKP